METYEKTADIRHFKCSGCGADLTYKPGTHILKCNYCDTEQPINDENVKTVIEESDYRAFFADNTIPTDQKKDVQVIKCNSCGALVTFKPNTVSDLCIFCGSPVVIQNPVTNTIIKPRYLLPFKITKNNSFELFQKWIKKLWFAPNKLKKYRLENERLNGVYIPYWTYDTDTSSSYTGERGIDHTESYTVTVNGRQERRTRTVTRWHSVSGHVSTVFDDVLILASTSLPKKYADELEPWDLSNLTEYDDQYLSGFRTESYEIDLESGFNLAKNVMEPAIREKIRRDIGGDHQRISSLSTTYNNITFKHILLPVWISAYRYKTKVYRFMINGRTGEVQGERPWSWVKITLASLAASAFIAGIYFGYLYLKQSGVIN
jgi:LSD1 subclass zinc finger protein